MAIFLLAVLIAALALSRPIFAYNDIYPLRNIKFEGAEFPAVNNVEKHLEELYGNYMEYPKDIWTGHTICRTLKEEELEFLKKFVQEKGDC